MMVDTDSSISVAPNPSDDDTRPAFRNPPQRLTREQFEAAMRVMDAHSVARRVPAAEDASPTASS